MPSKNRYDLTQIHSNEGFKDDISIRAMSGLMDKENEFQMKVYSKEAFMGDSSVPTISGPLDKEDSREDVEEVTTGPMKRDQWSKPIEFLLSCIAMSVGLGNVWRFPFTAYENGGGAFLIPYLIVLFSIGRPLYFMEVAMGQFSSYSQVKVWNVVPLAKGVGYGQAIGLCSLISYYSSLMAVTVYYFFASFQSQLPWSYCDPSWATDTCYESGTNVTKTNLTGLESSAEQYFRKSVLKTADDIDDGVGLPDWKLSLCLLFCWLFIFLCLVHGVKSSGKASYFLATLPFLVLFILLIRGITLPGASKGILFFIKPKWQELLNPKVWFAAVIQCLVSLSVGFGPLISYSSFNSFRHNLYSDAVIITVTDTMTSLLAGFTIFAILGNLAEDMNVEVDAVVKSDSGIAFVSYPDAIAKFKAMPQLFSVLFFFMLFTLGLGSIVAEVSSIISIMYDECPHWNRSTVTAVVSVIGFLTGLVYVTPGGQYILRLVDYYGVGLSIFILEIIEVVIIHWVYGIDNFKKDIEFMLGFKLNFYWTFCWSIFIPIALMGVFLYSVFGLEKVKYNDHVYPTIAYALVWMISASAVMMFPLFLIYAVFTSKKDGMLQKLKAAAQYTDEWGPKDPNVREEWLKFKTTK